MNDDRLHRWLEGAEQPLDPSLAFAAALRDELRRELGHLPATDALAIAIDLKPARARRRPPLARLLLVAALLAILAAGLLMVAGAIIDRSPTRRSALFDRIERTGNVRIAIRPDHPQFPTSGQPAAGFDADVGRALADRLALSMKRRRRSHPCRRHPVRPGGRDVGHRAAIGRRGGDRPHALPGHPAVLTTGVGG